MKIRTQLILAFLLLAVLPMSVIVLVGYVSSQRAVRQAVEAEVALLTVEMENRMERVRQETRRRVERLGELPFRRLAGPGASKGDERMELFDTLVGELGESAALVESFEYVPMAPEEVSPDTGATPRPPAPAPSVSPKAVVIEMQEVMRQVERELRKVEDESVREQMRARAQEGLAAAAVAMKMFGGDGSWLEDAGTAEEWEAKVRFETGEAEAVGDIEPEAPEDVVPGLEASAIETDREFESFRVDFGSGLKVPVREEGRVVGEVLARVKGEELLRRVLGRTQRTQGEVPFALDQDGKLFTVNEEDRAAIAGLPLQGGETENVLENWVVVTTDVPASGMSFGIARPIRESLAEIRRTALRNFGFGVGLISLALLGVLPISRRMSNNLQEVTVAAARVAEGDLSTRVPVRSRNEIGQLAQAFNSMATDLASNRERLLEEQRAHRDHEVERTLLQAEVDRQTEELEEARRFQLSLLPRSLPEHQSFELAVEMRTATEVGGDYYDFQMAPGGVLTAAVGDATGHGAAAGTMVTVIKSLFSAYPPGESLSSFLSDAGSAIRRMDLGRMAMAMALARLDGPRLTLATAGMPPALLFRQRSGRVEEIQLKGMPLGSFATEYSERTVDVASGDTLLLMTDGLPELPNPDGEPLGYQRAAEKFERYGGSPLETVIEQLCLTAEDWAGGGAPADDVTFVALRVR
jgi:serine phosphatase RsbU (regulator of sigma subunit)